jgi:phosphate transport system substrate-binding protein
MKIPSNLILTGALVVAATGTFGVTSQLASAADRIAIDGSSTVYPITEAVAEEFQKVNDDVQVTVGVSGTGGGFEQFCRGRIAISDASRPIEENERQLCRKNGIEYIELPIALDAVTVIVNPDNDWVQCMTVEELKTIWEPAAQGKITSWNQVRKAWPKQELVLFGPGADSGTFDYFTDAIMGEEGMIRGDFTPSEDDNVLVQGVAQSPGGLAYFGYAYYEENQDILKAVAIDSGEGCVEPSFETTKNGTYQPLSRPLFIYISKQAAEKDYVRKFVEFYLDPQRATELVAQVGYVPLPQEVYQVAMQNFKNRKLGTAFASGDMVGVSIEGLLKREKVN